MGKKDRTEKGFGVFLQAIPWPWHVGLGGIVYLILHALAGREIPLPDQTPEEVALYTHRLVWKTAAAIFQYLLPALFFLLAIFSYRRAGEKRKLRNNDG
ncbi:MAG: hypothetical protein ABR523_04465 [Desulfurivibrionaceae bacterium]